ncbi:MAG: hypothetical protein ACLFUH_00470 [Bacteroidales bacterium]
MLEIDTSQIDNFAKELGTINVQNLKEQYFEYLQSEINISNELIKQINNRVYSNERKPDMYKWTYSLLGAVRCRREGSRLVLYMDDKWLEDNKAGYMSDETGWSPNEVLSGGSSKSYSERVEEGHTYHNIKYSGHEKESTGPTDYYKTAINNIEEQLDGVAKGNVMPAKLLEPLLKVW